MIKRNTKIVMTEADYHSHTNNCDGFCLHCHEQITGEVEPDAEKYECEACGENQVYGMMSLLFADKIMLKQVG